MNTVMNNPISREVARIALKAKGTNLTHGFRRGLSGKPCDRRQEHQSRTQGRLPWHPSSVFAPSVSGMGNAIPRQLDRQPQPPAPGGGHHQQYKAGSFNGCRTWLRIQPV